jgi:hypothetical protein
MMRDGIQQGLPTKMKVVSVTTGMADAAGLFTNARDCVGGPLEAGGEVRCATRGTRLPVRRSPRRHFADRLHT